MRTLLRALLSDLPPERLAWLLPDISPLDLVEDPANQPERAFAAREFSKSEIAVLTGILQAMRRARAATSGDSEIGSNSWVVSGAKTVSGKPILASDPHLPVVAFDLAHCAFGRRPFARLRRGGSGRARRDDWPQRMDCVGHNESLSGRADLYFEQLDPANPSSYKTPAGWRDAEIRTERSSFVVTLR